MGGLMTKNAVNAGVGAQTGFALQRNMALFILLDNYEQKFQGQNYFVSLEHHDDFLFCFLDDEDKAKLVEAYQSKKKSSNGWTINKDFGEILHKLLNVGIDLNNDSIPKTSTYGHQLNFSSNANIFLAAKLPKGSSEKSTTVTVNEESTSVNYSDLNGFIQNEIISKIKSSNSEDVKPLELDELKNLNFMYVEFVRTNKEQKNQLEGKITEVFGDQVIDSRAALETIIALFHDIELTYNQNKTARLLDPTKRVTSPQINNAIDIITTKSKAFDLWRNQKSMILETLQVRPSERDSFELNFDSAFDHFKSLDQAEHKKVLEYVNKNWDNCSSYTDINIIMELNSMYLSNQSTPFSPIALKAIIYAAFFEVTFKRSNF